MNVHLKSLRKIAFELKELAEKESANGRVDNAILITDNFMNILRAQEGLVCLEKGRIMAIKDAHGIK